jgi:hypothetical protein
MTTRREGQAVTEGEWLACSDPETMLDFLEGRSGSRKLRLFACACCRRVWPLLPDERSRRAVETAERYADGLAGEKELEAAGRGAGDAVDQQTRLSIEAGTGPDGPAVSAAAAAMNATNPEFVANDPEGSAPFYAASNALLAVTDAFPSKGPAERAAQCHLLRDIFGNPFHPSVLDTSLLTPAVVGLALLIYEETAFDRVRDLADVLEGQGCRDADALDHCRGPGPHVRGCWVVDLVRGKATKQH